MKIPHQTKFFKKKRRNKIKRNAKKEIERLLEFAQQVSTQDLDLARDIILIARRMAMKIRLPISREYKRRFCRKCNTPYTTRTVRIRVGVHHPHVTYSCRHCGYIKRIPYRPKKTRSRE